LNEWGAARLERPAAEAAATTTRSLANCARLTATALLFYLPRSVWGEVGFSWTAVSPGKIRVGPAAADTSSTVAAIGLSLLLLQFG
jgi:hypothetical protein